MFSRNFRIKQGPVFFFAACVFALSTLSSCVAERSYQRSEVRKQKHAMVRLESPLPGAVINSPLTVQGEARGPWYFEGDFPLILKDHRDNILARGVARAQGRWMTTAFVPFSATLTFTAPADGRGQLILQKDNPSERRELDDSVVIPVGFE